MSAANTPRSAGQPKQMSAGLMNMKFMKRAAAAAASPLSATPTPQTPYEPFTKRQKLSNGTSSPSSTGTTTPLSEPAFGDRTAISAALDAESRSKSHVIARPEGSETDWVLSLPTNGHSAPAQEDEDDDIWHPTDSLRGRQSYGGFKRRKTNPVTAAVSCTPRDGTGTESGEVSSDEAGPDTPEYLVKSSRARWPQKDEDAEGRRMDRLNLKGMSGISGSSGPGGGMKPMNGKGMKDRERGKKKRKT